MEEKSTSNLKVTLTNGAILGLALIIYSVILYVMDLSLNKYMGWVSYLIIIGFLIYATKSYRDNNLNGNISYGKALGFATLVVLFAAILQAIYTYLYITVIDTEFVNKLIAMTEERMIEQGTMSDDQIEMAISMQKKMMKPVLMSIMGLVSTMFFGFIIALITSAFIKKEGDPYQSAMQDIEE